MGATPTSTETAVEPTSEAETTQAPTNISAQAIHATPVNA